MRRFSIVVVFALLLLTSALAAPPTTCATAQWSFDSVYDSGYNQTSWSSVQAMFGDPLNVEEGKPYVGQMRLIYAYPGCQLSFVVGNEGKITSKKISLTAAALLPQGVPTASAVPAKSDVALYIASLQATAQQLQVQLDRLQGAIEKLKNSQLASNTTTSPVIESASTPAALVLGFAPAPPTSTPVSVSPATTAAGTLTTAGCAENGSCYGDISAATGKPKTVQVDGYTRKDGTYVRGYYRSK